MSSTLQQTLCAKRGHRFPNGEDGVCSSCGLTVTPAGGGNDGERQAA